MLVLVIITRGPGREINTNEDDEDDSVFTTPGPASVLIKDTNYDTAFRTSTRGTTKATNTKRRKKLKKIGKENGTRTSCCCCHKAATISDDKK